VIGPSHAGDADYPLLFEPVVLVKKQDPLIWYLEMKCDEDMMSERASFRMLLQCKCKYAEMTPRYA
jgi:hypothetical protein